MYVQGVHKDSVGCTGLARLIRDNQTATMNCLVNNAFKDPLSVDEGVATGDYMVALKPTQVQRATRPHYSPRRETF